MTDLHALPTEHTAAAEDTDWWRSAVIYQVYVRSFFDANGDGVGDLAGVRAKLGYLHDIYRDWRSIADSYSGTRVLVGELWLEDGLSGAVKG